MQLRRTVPAAGLFALLLACNLAFASSFGNQYGGTLFVVAPDTASSQSITFAARETARIESIAILVRKYGAERRNYPVSIAQDNSGKPGTVMATSSVLFDDAPGRLWKVIAFPPGQQPSLAAGSKYHIVLQMPAGTSSEDRVALAYLGGTGQPSTVWHDTLAEGSLKILASPDGSTWAAQDGSPSFALFYAKADGSPSGNGDGNPYDSITSGGVYGAKWVSQTFSLPRPLQIQSLSAMVRKVGPASPSDHLYAQLMRQDGTLFGARLVIADKDAISSNYAYLTANYFSPVLIPAGNYQLVFSSPASGAANFYRWLAVQTHFDSAPMVERTFAGTASHAKASEDSGASWTDLLKGVDLKLIDHSFYLTAVEAVCTDGTPISTCSSNQPKYCDSVLSLVDNPDTCSCPAGYRNVNSKCELVDVIPPHSTILGLNSVLNGVQTLTASAWDAPGYNTGVDHVKYEAKNPSGSWVEIGSSSTPPYSVDFNTAGIVEGETKLRSTAYDLEGNAEAPNEVSVSIDSVAPATGSLEVLYPNVKGIQKDEADPGDTVTLRVHGVRDRYGIASVETVSTSLPGAPLATFSKKSAPGTSSPGARVLWLRLDGASGGIVPDFSGYNNVAVLQGSASINPLGKFASAATFDGTSYASVNGVPARLAGLSSYAVSLWFKPSSLAGKQTLAEVATVPFNDAPLSMSLKDGNRIWFAVANAGNADNTEYVLPTPLQAGEWHHLVAVRSGPSTAMYLDGISVANGFTSAPAVASKAYSFSIGSGNLGGATENFNGSIDDVQVWTRALSASEVSGTFSGLPPVDTSRYQASLTIPANADEGTYTVSIKLTDTATPLSNLLEGKDFKIEVRRAGFAAAAQPGSAGSAPAIPATALIGATIAIALLLASYSVWKEHKKA